MWGKLSPGGLTFYCRQIRTIYQHGPFGVVNGDGTVQNDVLRQYVFELLLRRAPELPVMSLPLSAASISLDTNKALLSVTVLTDKIEQRMTSSNLNDDVRKNEVMSSEYK
jgi:hypothetical protein